MELRRYEEAYRAVKDSEDESKLPDTPLITLVRLFEYEGLQRIQAARRARAAEAEQGAAEV